MTSIQKYKSLNRKKHTSAERVKKVNISVIKCDRKSEDGIN